ncbi:MAG: recombinase [Bacteroidales bacterium]|nr:recombinase [Bacteroidales bacterium]
MGNLFESLKSHFENTPKEVLEREWNEIKHLNEIGPDVLGYAKFVKEQFGVAMQYCYANDTEKRKYDVSVDSGFDGISADSQYFFAA